MEKRLDVTYVYFTWLAVAAGNTAPILICTRNKLPPAILLATLHHEYLRKGAECLGCIKGCVNEYPTMPFLEIPVTLSQ